LGYTDRRGDNADGHIRKNRAQRVGLARADAVHECRIADIPILAEHHPGSLEPAVAATQNARAVTALGRYDVWDPQLLSRGNVLGHQRRMKMNKVHSRLSRAYKH